MPDQDPVTSAAQPETNFHAIKRAPRRSRPRIIVEYERPVAMLALEFGVGEPGHVRKVLDVERLGEFPFPEVMPHDALLSYRGRWLPLGEIRITVIWEDPE